MDTSKQRIDSTAVRSAIRGLTRLGIFVEATAKFLRELRRKDAALFATVDEAVVRKYLDREGDGCFSDTRPSESKRRLPEAARDVFALVEQFRSRVPGELESFQLLQKIFHEQCEVIGAAEPRVEVRTPSHTNSNHGDI